MKVLDKEKKSSQREIINQEQKQEKMKNKIERSSKKIEDFFKNNILFLIGIILLVYKGTFLNYLLGLEINVDTLSYILIASRLHLQEHKGYY